MNFKHFLVEAAPAVETKLDAFVGARKRHEAAASSGSIDRFRGEGLQMAKAYVELADSLGLGIGFFADQATGRAAKIRVERSRSEWMVTVPAEVTIKVDGVVPISVGDYLNMRENAEQSVARAASDARRTLRL